MSILPLAFLVTLFGTACCSPVHSSQPRAALRVEITGMVAGSSIDDVKMRAVVTNMGQNTVRLLKYQTVLDPDLPTRSFYVTKGEVIVPFTGIELILTVHDLDESAFVTLGPGEDHATQHDLSSLYDFSEEGSYSFEPITSFLIMPNDGFLHPASGHLDIELPARVHTMNLHGMRRGRVKSRATDVCQDSAKASFIDAAYAEAKSLAAQSSSYVSTHGAGDGTYRKYYHAASTSEVSAVFDRVANENSPSRELGCNDPRNSCRRGVLGYTAFPSTNVYFCPPFFSEVSTENLCSTTNVNQRNIRGETMLHELTHATSHTHDLAYGCQSVQKLSDSSAKRNADSYACFATEVYSNTVCR
ncbi:hypothetical protein HDZ31DRAFT_40774 [Schizophyllum fasciatum]